MLGLDEVQDLATFNDDGTFEVKPIMHHFRIFKGLLLFYNQMSQELSFLLEEDK
jgi:hypothetical protein